MDLPTVPILFIKPSTALNGPGELPIPRVAQDGTADFESELCVIIGKDARDVSEENAFEHVLGYTSSVSRLELYSNQKKRILTRVLERRLLSKRSVCSVTMGLLERCAIPSH